MGDSRNVPRNGINNKTEVLHSCARVSLIFYEQTKEVRKTWRCRAMLQVDIGNESVINAIS